MKFICDKCKICYDSNDGYDNILIAMKITYGYEWQHYCYTCGKHIHDALNTILNENEVEHD